MNSDNKPWRPYRQRRGQRSIATRNTGLLNKTNQKLKRQYFKDGIRACEVCHWAPPSYLARPDRTLCLRLHHLVPLCLDGPLEERSNTLLLCPNHAALGDVLAFTMIDIDGNYCGPRTRAEIIELLRDIDRNPDSLWIRVTSKVVGVMHGLNGD
jgi:hypothetical protein